MQYLTENEIEWLYTTTVQKLQQSFAEQTINETELESEMLKIKLWAEKAYKNLDSNLTEE